MLQGTPFFLNLCEVTQGTKKATLQSAGESLPSDSSVASALIFYRHLISAGNHGKRTGGEETTSAVVVAFCEDR